MEDLTLSTLIAVFEEMFGAGLFWSMVAAAVVITLAYLFVLLRDKRVGMRKFLIAQLFMPVGAIAAVWFTLAMTDSALRDMGGAVDIVVLLGIAAVGGVGIAILVYTVEAFFFRGATADAKDRHRAGFGQPAE